MNITLVDKKKEDRKPITMRSVNIPHGTLFRGNVDGYETSLFLAFRTFEGPVIIYGMNGPTGLFGGPDAGHSWTDVEIHNYDPVNGTLEVENG